METKKLLEDFEVEAVQVGLVGWSGELGSRDLLSTSSTPPFPHLELVGRYFVADIVPGC